MVHDLIRSKNPSKHLSHHKTCYTESAFETTSMVMLVLITWMTKMTMKATMFSSSHQS